MRGIRASVHQVVDVGRRDELKRNVALLFDLFALSRRECGIERCLALAGGILEHGKVEIARLLAASASCVASTPPTTTWVISLAGL